MSTHQTRNDRHAEQPSGSEFVGEPCCARGVDYSSPCGNWEQMMQTGPCADWFRRHRLAVYTALTLAALGLLVLPAVWVLGIIAFFRTF